MKHGSIHAIVAVSLLVVTALPASGTTAKQACDYQRTVAWRAFLTCIETAAAKEARGTLADVNATFAICRHRYFKKWADFQSNRAVQGSVCVGSRFTDNNDGSVTDNLSNLTWEKKDDAGGLHDKDSSFTWSNTGTAADGSAYVNFLQTLNSTGLHQFNDWQLPTMAELQTIVADFPCSGAFGGATCRCASSPCIDPAFDSTNTQASSYWTGTSDIKDPTSAWTVPFETGAVASLTKTSSGYARAVRGNL